MPDNNESKRYKIARMATSHEVAGVSEGTATCEVEKDPFIGPHKRPC